MFQNDKPTYNNNTSWNCTNQPGAIPIIKHNNIQTSKQTTQIHPVANNTTTPSTITNTSCKYNTPPEDFKLD